MFITFLGYKLFDRGKQLVKINKWFPSSQTCHVCGETNPITKNLSVRQWVCCNCGVSHNRDINAAINIVNGRSIGIVGLLGTKKYEEHLSKLRTVWSKANEDYEDDNNLLSCEMTAEEQLADSLAVFGDNYKFCLHPDGIMPFIYQSKLVVEQVGLWTEELQAKYDNLELKYKKYALKDVPDTNLGSVVSRPTAILCH